MSEVRIRGFQSAEADELVELRRLLRPEEVLTPDSLTHWFRTGARKTRRRWWVARDGSNLMGFAMAALESWTTDEGIANLWVGIHPDWQGRGIGSRMYELAESHLLRLDPRKVYTWVREGDKSSSRFASKRGFRKARTSKVWELDPRKVDLSELLARVEAKKKEGFELVSLGELKERPRDFYDAYLPAVRDVPWDHPIEVSFRQWKKEVWDSPELDFQGSRLVMFEERPVSFVALAVDRVGGRAYHDLTGTIPEFRRRGLAKLAKMAAIEWCVENRITRLFTDNDSTNADMLAINDHLGYKPRPASISLARVL